MNKKTVAQRQADLRERRARLGLRPLTVFCPVERREEIKAIASEMVRQKLNSNSRPPSPAAE